MNVVVLHDHIAADARADEIDALVQAEAVSKALVTLGHRPTIRSCSLNLSALASEFSLARPDLVFNLAESLGGQGALAHVVPALLDVWDIPYTGTKTEGMFLTSSKLLTKQFLTAREIATPPWLTLAETVPARSAIRAVPRYPGRFIIKAIWEEASFGIDSGAIVEARNEADLRGKLAQRSEFLGREAFAEAYIDGREFNLSVLETEKGPVVLPPAEIDFGDFPPDKPRIVDYAAKWDVNSFEYHHTPRRFEFANADRELLDQLVSLAVRCWGVFGLRGYVRVDFRVDDQRRPWVLEINANPCISPDAGFVAAAERGGLDFVNVVDAIVRSAMRGAARPASRSPIATR